MNNPNSVQRMSINAEQMAIHAPKTWKKIAGKRYILPQYRSDDYHSQEKCDRIIGLFLTAYFGREFGQRPNTVLNAQAGFLIVVSNRQSRAPILLSGKQRFTHY